MRTTTRYRKSAGVVGEVLKNYHPHGDTAVYDTLVRMAQDFNLRYPLVDGQGNFGSVDGDGAAAMRYTESRLLADRRRDAGRYRQEHRRLQAQLRRLAPRSRRFFRPRLPNLLLNGSAGIAVGMATNIPPHNLNEICDAIALLIDNPDATVDDLMEIVTGSGFPDRRHDSRPRGHPRRLRHRPRPHRHPRQGVRRGIAPAANRYPDRRHRAAVPGQQGDPARAHRRAGARKASSTASATCATSRTAPACA